MTDVQVQHHPHGEHSHDHDHAHDHDHDHGHGFDGSYTAAEFSPTERVTLTTVGIDIGSATTYAVFSRLTLQRRGALYSSRFDVVGRELVARSPIALTPYATPKAIDAGAVAGLVEAAYAHAGLTPAAVDTGAVLVTGEAARKDNAARIIEEISRYAGGFVCATAGPVLEGTLAAYGSGTVAYAQATGAAVLNLDIGGGTTKITLARDGRVAHVTAVNVGGRLIAWDGDRTVTRVEPAGARLAQAAGVTVALGAPIRVSEVAAIADVGAHVVVASLTGAAPARPGCAQRAATGEPLTELAKELTITEPLPPNEARDIVASGGVGSLIVDDTATFDGDLGAPLAAAIRWRLAALADAGWRLVPARETIQATGVGVAEFTMQLSGNTIHAGAGVTLPLRNLPVVAVPLPALVSAADAARRIRDGLARGGLTDGADAVALALRLPPVNSPADLYVLVDAIAQAMPRALAGAAAFVLIIDADVAGVVGHLLAGEPGTRAPLVVLDQVDVAELDFVDVGAVDPGSGSVPIVVKSLIF